MAILVDDAIWPWRGQRWAHLVTDSHLDELHDFAHRLGVPYLAFQGDHYDVPTEIRAAAVRHGAREVTGRQVVAALRAAGLRRRGAVEPWTWEWRCRARNLDARPIPSHLADHLTAAVSDLVATGVAVEVGLAARTGEQLAVVSSDVALDVDAGLHAAEGGVTVHRSSGARGTWIELLVPR